MLTLYLTLATLWTVYMAIETYGFSNPHSRPYFVGFLMTEFVLMPISLALELMTADGYLRAGSPKCPGAPQNAPSHALGLSVKTYPFCRIALKD